MDIKIPNRKKFKSDREYLNEVYNLNRGMISSAYEGILNKKEAFIKQIFDNMKQKGLPIKETVRKELWRSEYLPPKERFKENLIQGLKKHEMVAPFKRLLRDERGHFVKFNKDNISYVGDKSYKYFDEYGNHFVVVLDNSPESIQILDFKSYEIYKAKKDKKANKK